MLGDLNTFTVTDEVLSKFSFHIQCLNIIELSVLHHLNYNTKRTTIGGRKWKS